MIVDVGDSGWVAPNINKGGKIMATIAVLVTMGILWNKHSDKISA